MCTCLTLSHMQTTCQISGAGLQELGVAVILAGPASIRGGAGLFVEGGHLQCHL